MNDDEKYGILKDGTINVDQGDKRDANFGIVERRFPGLIATVRLAVDEALTKGAGMRWLELDRPDFEASSIAASEAIKAAYIAVSRAGLLGLATPAEIVVSMLVIDRMDQRKRGKPDAPQNP